MKSIPILLLLLFTASPSIAAEAHAWARLTDEGKFLVITNYDRGYGLGCLNGVMHSTQELFADQNTQFKQYMKLNKHCAIKYIDTVTIAKKIINIIDTTYKVPGSADIPLPIIIDLAIKTHKNGDEQIPKDKIESWAKSNL